MAENHGEGDEELTLSESYFYVYQTMMHRMSWKDEIGFEERLI